MSKFETSESEITAADLLKNDMKRADKEARRSLQTWMQNVDIFWCAPITHGENSHSIETCQAKLDIDPVASQTLLSASSAHLTYHLEQDPDLVAEIVDPRYLLEGAYTWGEGLTLLALRPEYDVQSEED
tara:strand:- start:36972 stop:37358 length:387 start_codon:yes stop_codon:yes gene_type:complete